MKAQMAIWAIWSAPLFMSNDLSKISNEEKKLLTNKHLLEVIDECFKLISIY